MKRGAPIEEQPTETLAPAESPELAVTAPSAPSSPGALAPGTRLGRFVLLHELGAGGMGVVYAAYDPELDREVAVKLLAAAIEAAPGGPQRLVDEARAMAQLAHPNVIGVHDVGTWNGRMFLAMERVRGSDLRVWLGARPRAWRQVLGVLVGAGRGLAAAHAAGIVHRDFKPANVLVTDDGVAKVGDFGLARSAREDSDGTIAGTPAFMAPEQARGDVAIAASDQYAFGVAAYEALYRTRPFPPEAPAATRDRANPPPRSPVPRRIGRALVRAMSPAPADRFSDMGELLGELEDAARVRRRAIFLGGGLVLVGAGAVTALALRPPADVKPPDRCAAAGAGWADAWDAMPARARLVEQFTRVSPASGAEVAALTATAIDGYGARWESMRIDACRATFDRGEQSERLLDLRMRCLDRRLDDVRALVELLAAADAAAVANAPKAAASLRDLRACADRALLEEEVPPPDVSPAREQHQEAVQELARARSMIPLGRVDEARVGGERALAAATASGHAPTVADAELVVSDALERLSDYDLTDQHLRHGLDQALRGHHDEAAAAALTKLVWLVGYDRGDVAKGEELANLADAMVVRLGDPALLRADLDNSYGSLLMRAARLDEAYARFERVVARRSEVLAADDYRLAGPFNNMGNVRQLQMRYADAIPLFERAVSILEHALGPNHPELATVLNNKAGVHAALSNGDGPDAPDQRAKARALHVRALEIRRKALGDDSLPTAQSMVNVGAFAIDEGDLAEGRTLIEKAIATFEKRLGADHPFLSMPLKYLADAQLRGGDLGAAFQTVERAIALARSAGEAMPEGSAELWLVRARVLWKMGRRADARATAREGLAVAAKDPSGGLPRQEIEKWMADPEAY